MNLKVVGAAALLATIAPLAAHADGDKAFTLKLGAYQPGNGHTQNRLSNTWFTAGADMVLKGTKIGDVASAATANSIEPLVYVDYTGTETHDNGHTEKAGSVGAGAGARYYGTYTVTSDFRPYIGGGVGVYFLNGQFADSTGAETSTHDQVNLGFKVNAGVEYQKSYLVDVAYSTPGEVKGVSLNGLAVTLGVRF
jgi:outer membrane protein W